MFDQFAHLLNVGRHKHYVHAANTELIDDHETIHDDAGNGVRVQRLDQYQESKSPFEKRTYTAIYTKQTIIFGFIFEKKNT